MTADPLTPSARRLLPIAAAVLPLALAQDGGQ